MQNVVFFSDMDETFLATDKSIPRQNSEALNQLKAMSCSLVPCSGRAWYQVPAALLAHPAVHYVVGSNGSVVRDIVNARTIRELTLTKESLMAVAEGIEGIRCSFDIFEATRVVSPRSSYELLPSLIKDEPTRNEVIQSRTYFEGSVRRAIECGTHMTKVTLYCDSEGDRDAIRRVVLQDPNLTLVSSHPQNLEITVKGATKGDALQWLCTQVLGTCVQPAYSVAFGDNANDISMIQAASDGVAVSNAKYEVKRVAKHICGSHNDGGVGVYIMNILKTQ